MSRISRTAYLLIGVSFAVFGFWKYRSAVAGAARPNPVDLDRIPYAIAGWKGVDERLDEGVLGILGVDRYIMRTYRRGDGESVILYIGYYVSQDQARRIHSPRHCYPGAGWSPLDDGDETIFIPGERSSVCVRRFVVGKENQREVVYYWYDNHGRIMRSEFAAKVYMVYNAIVHGRNDGALVRFSTRTGTNTEKGRAALDSFVSEMYPTISAILSRP